MSQHVPNLAAQGLDATADHSKGARKRPARKRPRPFTAKELLQIGKDISGQWFRPVETNCLTLMEIDPWNVHAYWNFAEADLAAARENLPGKGRDDALVLRFTDISPRLEAAAPREKFDIEVHQESNNWYVNLWHDNWHYSAELGLRATNGVFTSLLCSNEAIAPRAVPSPALDFRELEVRSPCYKASGLAANGSEVNDILLRDLFPKRRQPFDDYPLVIAGGGYPSVSLEEPEFPSLAEEVEEAAGFADLQQQLPSLPRISMEGIAPADRELTSQPLPIPMPAAEKESLAVAKASSGKPPIPLEGLLAETVFSYAGGDATAKVAAHVVIEGQAAPETAITLFGKRVQLRSDSSFTLRLPLQRGPELLALLHHLRGRYGDWGEG